MMRSHVSMTRGKNKYCELYRRKKKQLIKISSDVYTKYKENAFRGFCVICYVTQFILKFNSIFRFFIYDHNRVQVPNRLKREEKKTHFQGQKYFFFCSIDAVEYIELFFFCSFFARAFELYGILHVLSFSHNRILIRANIARVYRCCC